MSITFSKAKRLPSRVVLGCTECEAHLEVPITSDVGFLQRFVWLAGGWLFTMTKDNAEGKTPYNLYAPLCRACQPRYFEPELLSVARKRFEDKHGPAGEN